MTNSKQSLSAEELADRLESLLKGATARPWKAFDQGTTLAVMKGKCPPLKGNGYPTRPWPEIIKWTGFDAADVPWRQRRANLHLIVGAVNALPEIIEALRSRSPLEDNRNG